MGMHSGDYLVEWLGGILEEIGVTTFEQLRMDDPGSSLPEASRYSLIVHTADITRRKVVRLPWDYGNYGLDPGRQRIVDAVRASMSIPFFFEPVRLHAPAATYDGVTYSKGSVIWVDGGLLSNFPVEVFDRSDGQPHAGRRSVSSCRRVTRRSPPAVRVTTRSTKRSIVSRRCSTTPTATTSPPTRWRGRSSSIRPASPPPTSVSPPSNARPCSPTGSSPQHNGWRNTSLARPRLPAELAERRGYSSAHQCQSSAEPGAKPWPIWRSADRRESRRDETPAGGHRGLSMSCTLRLAVWMARVRA